MTYKSAHILIVDDEAPVRLTLGALLERRGYAVTVASTGRDALRWLQRHHFDLLVLDVMLPDVHGADVAEQARVYQPHVGLIIFTGPNPDENRLDGPLPEDAVYLLKTVDPQKVLNQIAETLSHQQEQSFVAALHGAAIAPKRRKRRATVASSV